MILQHCIYKFNTISTVNIVTAIVFFIIIMTGAIFMISIRVGFVVIIFIFFIRCLIPANLRPTSKTAQDIFLITFKFLDYGLELNWLSTRIYLTLMCWTNWTPYIHQTHISEIHGNHIKNHLTLRLCYKFIFRSRCLTTLCANLWHNRLCCNKSLVYCLYILLLKYQYKLSLDCILSYCIALCFTKFYHLYCILSLCCKEHVNGDSSSYLSIVCLLMKFCINDFDHHIRWCMTCSDSSGIVLTMQYYLILFYCTVLLLSHIVLSRIVKDNTMCDKKTTEVLNKSTKPTMAWKAYVYVLSVNMCLYLCTSVQRWRAIYNRATKLIWLMYFLSTCLSW